VPTIDPARDFTEVGGLMSYGPNISLDLAQQAGTYAGKFSRAPNRLTSPSNKASRLELVINLKTANALGLTIPPTILALADEVIE
jgi:putative ABC transport system substrate-binding protein